MNTFAYVIIAGAHWDNVDGEERLLAAASSSEFSNQVQFHTLPQKDIVSPKTP